MILQRKLKSLGHEVPRVYMPERQLCHATYMVCDHFERTMSCNALKARF